MARSAGPGGTPGAAWHWKGERALNLEIRVSRLDGPTLVQDYYACAPALAPFFAGWPWDPEVYRRKAEEVDRRFDAGRRRRMAEAIRATTPAAAAKLERVANGEGVFVTTGQQAGLFGGPLFTVYKILTAVRLAEALEPVLGRPVVPLFWVASDDHDWEEVNHVHVVDGSNAVQRIAVEGEGEAEGVGSSMARRRLGAGVEAALGRLADLMPQTSFAASYLELLRRAYRPERTVAQAFGDVIAELFAEFDLLVVDPAHPVVKELSAGVLALELERSAEHEALLARQSSGLEAAGYHVQVGVLPGAANVFFEDEAGRERLVAEDGGWVLRRTRRRLETEELRALLESEPGRFSPNVLLRPVVESAVFPTVAYVAGPSELSYYAQVRCLFQAHGMEMPVVYPRASVTLIEAKVRKVLDKFGLGVEDFRRPTHEVAARVLREELPEDVVEALAWLRRALGEGYGRLAEAAKKVDATLGGPVIGARNAAYVQLEEVEKKIAAHLKTRNAVGLEQLEKARTNLFPLGQPQERVLSVMPYLARYGPELLQAIAGQLAVELEGGPRA